MSNPFSSVRDFFKDVVAQSKVIVAETEAKERLPSEALNEQFAHEWKRFRPLTRYGILAGAMFKEFIYDDAKETRRFMHWKEFPADRAVLFHYGLHDEQRKADRRALEKEWGVRTIEDLRDKMVWLFDAGQMFEMRIALRVFNTYSLGADGRSVADRLNGIVVADSEALRKVLGDKAAQTRIAELREKNLYPDNVVDAGVAFDLARASTLITGAWSMGWMEGEELERHFADIGKILISQFGSWNEFGKDFIRGATFFMPEHRYRALNLDWYAATLRWLEEPEGPWAKIPLPEWRDRSDAGPVGARLWYDGWYDRATWEYRSVNESIFEADEVSGTFRAGPSETVDGSDSESSDRLVSDLPDEETGEPEDSAAAYPDPDPDPDPDEERESTLTRDGYYRYREGAFTFRSDVVQGLFGYDWRGRTYRIDGRSIEIVDPVLEMTITLDDVLSGVRTADDGQVPGLWDWIDRNDTVLDVFEAPIFEEMLTWHGLSELPPESCFVRLPYSPEDPEELFWDYGAFSLRAAPELRDEE